MSDSSMTKPQPIKEQPVVPRKSLEEQIGGMIRIERENGRGIILEFEV